MNRSSWTRLTTAVLLICVLGYSACTDSSSPPPTNMTEAVPTPTTQPPVAATSPIATPVPRPTATVQATLSPTSTPDAGEEEPRTSTPTAQVRQPTATPTTAAVSSAPTERIEFLPGATTFSLTGHLPASGDKLYVMNVAVGQYMEIDVAAEGGTELRLSLTGADGTVIQWLGPPHLKAVVPSTQDYTLRIAGDVEPVDYALSVFIPVRIVFAPGTTQATVTGALTGGGMRSYVLRAQAGQTLSVETRVTRGAVKTVIAGSDGTVLVSGNVAAGPVLGPLTLEATQDYLITVVETSGQSAQYTLTIESPASPKGEPIRLTFASGATIGVVQGTIPAQGTQQIIVSVAAGQWMEAQVPPQQGIELAVAGADGTVLQQGGGPVFRGVVPATQDYVITLTNYGGRTSYLLTVTIPIRIAFASGSTGATVQSDLLPNEIDRYVIRAMAGQTMHINTPTTAGQVTLAVYGVDGTILQNETGSGYDFSATLPTTQDYRIDVQAMGGNAAHYALDVAIGTLQIVAFSAEPLSGAAGDAIELHWEATGGRITVCPVVDDHWVGCRCLSDLPPSGTRTIRPGDIVGRYAGFELAVDGDGDRVTQVAAVQVACPATTPAWFWQDPPSMCPGAPALQSAAAAQRFEHGLMIWLADPDTYYILYDDLWGPSGTPIGPAPPVATLQIVQGPLDLVPGASPDHSTGEIPPPGRVEPVSGFGLVWRGEVRGVDRVRERLGWATAAEVGYAGAYQCEIPCGAQRDCYLLGPRGSIYQLAFQSPLGHVWQAYP